MTGPRSSRSRRARNALRQARLPLLGLAGVGALDLVQSSRKWSVPVTGALDEPAHLITAGLLLAAWPRRLNPRLAGWALVGSVLIDADHVPLYLGHMPTTVPNGRPVTHSLPTVAALLGGAAAARGRGRTALAGLGLGVCLHFVRDLALGEVGVPLMWPAVRRGDVRIPYQVYAGLLAAAATAAARVRWPTFAAGAATRPCPSRDARPRAARAPG